MNNRIFNAHYHSLLMRSDTDYDINESDVLPTSELYCSLGDYYLERGDRDAAERAYLTASHMIPTRLRPNYNLWRLYVKDNNPSAAHTMAERIMTMPLKNENSFTIKAKSDVRKYIEGEQY